MAHALTLGGPFEAPLSLDRLDALLGTPLNVSLTSEALARVSTGRAWVDQLVARGDAVYGVNTGFGHLKNTRISPDQLDALQENLLISHAVGVGVLVPRDIVRWMLLFKTHMLLAGHSGVRPIIVERLAAWLNHDFLPVVPTRGSLGASGDLAPLAHLMLPLIGRGELVVPPEQWRASGAPGVPALGAMRVDATIAQQSLGLAPLRLAAKEGLALINGTQFMSAYAANIAVRSRRLLNLVDLIYCMTLDGLRGSVRPADERLHQVRPHVGAQTVAANIRRLMQGSEILCSHENCDRVQDPYSLRCAPQVHGAVRNALRHFCETIEREINSVTDNPILFRGDFAPSAASPGAEAEPEAISGGNFHGEPLALVLDYLAIALTDLGNISERRIYLLLEGIDGLPKLLMRDTGLNSGFMLPQYTAAALVNECKVLASPASVDSIPSSLGQEDHVSMGATAAVKCYEILDRVETILAIEMLCAAQALDFRLPLRAGVGPRAAHDLIRKTITHADRDRLFGEDIHAALRLLRDNCELRRIAVPSA
ncbi:MAG: histidine ammonia-lyase [Phycisphaerales bacterium]|nr:histidine ammonia-lyase [Phycisphaerales bacterium]